MSEGRTAPVSAVIITRNEEAKIGRCLDSLTWADEIVVVDAKSSDATPKICQDPSRAWSQKIKFFSRDWSGFRDQRNFSIAQAKNDWLLVVDADEACSQELATKIKTLLTDPKGPPHSAYKVRRIEYFLGKPIHFGIWNPSYQDRFFHRDGVQYANEVHEYPIFKNPPHEIHEALHHSPDFSIEKFLKKMNEYTSLEARARLKEGQRTSVFKMLFAFPAMFLKNYFYYSAYKDGVHGFVISLLEGVSRVVRHVKMWQYEREQSR
jgi:glycosyltransferase involved in cell wall biosynthesis